MKVAALYDVHGNLPALEAVLAELESIRPDVILFGVDRRPRRPDAEEWIAENLLTVPNAREAAAFFESQR